MKTFLCVAILIFIGFCQWFFSDFFSLGLFSPDVVFSACLTFAVLQTPVTAFLMCFIFGLYKDMLGSSLVGANALVYTVVCYTILVVRKHFDFESFIPQLGLAFIMSVFSFILYQLVSQVFTGAESLKVSFLFIKPFLNAAIFPIVFAFIFSLFKHFKVQ